jgi:integrase
MRKVHFYTRGQKNNSKTIWLRLWHNQNNFRQSLGIKLYGVKWDDKEERAKPPKTYNLLNGIRIDIPNKENELVTINKLNEYLNNLSSNIDRFFLEKQLAQENITQENIKRFIYLYQHPKASSGNSLIDFIDDYIEENKTRLSASTNKPLTIQTQRKFILFKKYFCEYCQAVEQQVSFDDINLSFYEEFTHFLQDKNLAPNTIGKFINCIKSILNEATAKGINKNLNYKDSKFKIIKQEVDNIYLTEEEIKKIELVELPQNLNIVREMFLIGCYTGLRYSDFSRLTIDNVTKDGYINIVQQKTGKSVVIPLLSDYVGRLIENKTNYKPITNQALNRGIKDVCRLAGINDKSINEKIKGGKTISETVEKWELVSTHTARRSFATNMIKRGVPAQVVMAITGHHSEQSFRKYLKLNNIEKADILKGIINNQNK